MNINTFILGVIAVLILLIYLVFLIRELRVVSMARKIKELERDLSNALERVFELENKDFAESNDSFIRHDK